MAHAAVGEITYENMKAKIQKIFGDPAAFEGSSGASAVKSEPVFETKHEDGYQSTVLVVVEEEENIEVDLK